MSSKPSRSPKPAGGQFPAGRPVALTVLLLAAILLTLLPGGGSARAMDRAALGRVLQTIPPNGPFWKYGNVTMRLRAKSAGMAPVVFPHWNHRARYTCRVCHIELGFVMHLGGSGISRKQYLAGAFCGACHDGKTAFTARDAQGADCDRCHLKDTAGMQQRFDAFAEKLPVAHFGNGIDWAQAVEKGLIAPRPSLKEAAPVMPLPEKLKVPMRLGTTSPRSDVFFSHEKHFAELDCSSCHPDLFNIQKKGTEAFSMERNIFGEFCGACHMRVAFPMNDCRRCHPQMSNVSSF